MREISRKKILYAIQECLNDGKKQFVIFPYGEKGKIVKKILNEEFGIKEIAVVDSKLSSDDNNVLSLNDFCNGDAKDCVMLLSSDNKVIWNEIRNEVLKKYDGQVVDIANIMLSEFTFYEKKLKIEKCNNEQMKKIFEKTAMVWEKLGDEEPFWSVLSHDEFKTINMDTNAIKKFYDSGKRDVTRIGCILLRNGIVDDFEGMKNLEIVEIGCGCGRVTKSLASTFGKVTAVDISKGNLNVARKYISEKNVEYQLISEVNNYNQLPNADIVYSYLVLQHNCPPVIRYIINSMLRLLKGNGVAIFQVPTYKDGYKFEYESYINEIAGKGMEMHLLPQKIIFEIAYKNFCIPMEVYPVDATGNEDNSTFFVFRKLDSMI